MRLQSSNSVGARFLDRGTVLQSLRGISEGLVRNNPQVQGIALFGSLARGDYSARSDADILVCLRSASEERIADRIPPLLAAFLEAPIPVDILALTVAEIALRLRESSPFWRRVCREAMILAGSLPRPATRSDSS